MHCSVPSAQGHSGFRKEVHSSFLAQGHSVLTCSPPRIWYGDWLVDRDRLGPRDGKELELELE